MESTKEIDYKKLYEDENIFNERILRENLLLQIKYDNLKQKLIEIIFQS